MTCSIGVVCGRDRRITEATLHDETCYEVGEHGVLEITLREEHCGGIARRWLTVRMKDEVRKIDEKEVAEIVYAVNTSEN